MTDANDDVLVDAIERNDIAAASALIASGVNINGRSRPLHRAAALGRVEIMALLVDAGVDIDAVDEHQMSACHIAIFGRHFDALKLLVERGASLADEDAAASLFFAVARSNQHDDRILVLLLDADASIVGLAQDELVRMLARSRSVAVLTRLLARGVDVAALRDHLGNSVCHSVLWSASRDDDVEAMLGALVERAGVDVDAVDDEVVGMTLLHYATTYRSLKAMRALVALGADVDRQTSDGRTALHLLCEFDDEHDRSCAELLLALGFDVHLATREGQTACHRASRSTGHMTVLSACLAAGGDLDQPDNNGDTPRAIASERSIRLPTLDEIDSSRRRIAKTRLDLVRQRAFQICLGLHPINLDALQLCEILVHSCGAFGALIAFHQWWMIATKVKHFRTRHTFN
jgi:ankyrin repeat protein